MHPELFKLPFVDITVKSYGLMMVLGFLAAVLLIRRLSRHLGDDPEHITNAALYSLIAGVVGARAFYVIHHYDEFRGRLGAIFALWHGGLELLGGVILAIVVISLYLKRRKLAVRRYLDILAIALGLALAFGRIGCFMNGCCFGQPTEGWWGVRFPYNSPAYYSQVYPDFRRGRDAPRFDLPAEYFGYFGSDGMWREVGEDSKLLAKLKPYELLTELQKYEVRMGKYRGLAVHPTQLYSSVSGVLLSFLLYVFWRRNIGAEKSGAMGKRFIQPGCVLGMLFILYGPGRFLMEFLRDDNPIEANGLTISQNVGIGMVVAGGVLMVVFSKMKGESITTKSQ